MKKETRLYNVLFPVWMFFLIPTAVWLLILPGNFLVDTLVLVLWMYRRKMENKLQLWKRSILPVWLLGFLSDFVGAGLTMAIMFLLEEIAPNVALHLFPAATLMALPGVLLAGVLIYFLNRRFVFRKSGLSPEEIHSVCLTLALWTAPYTMLIPLYG